MNTLIFVKLLIIFNNHTERFNEEELEKLAGISFSKHSKLHIFDISLGSCHPSASEYTFQELNDSMLNESDY